MSDSEANEDEEFVEDQDLEYDEDASESEPSGSEFEADDDSVVADSQDEEELSVPRRKRLVDDEIADEGIDDEDVMIDAAIQESLRTAREGLEVAMGTTSVGAGSSRAKAPLNTAASLRAAAVEKRLGKRKAKKETEDFVPDSDETSELELAMSSSESEEEPIIRSKGKNKKVVASKKTKGKGKAKKMTAAEERKLRRAEEREMRKKLGRKLTAVSHPLVTYVYIVPFTDHDVFPGGEVDLGTA